MKTKVNDKENIIFIISLAIVAAVGGAVNYVGEYLNKVSKLPPEMVNKVALFQIKHCFAQMFVSGFCGGLVGFATTKTVPDWSYIVAGFAGVFGLQIFYLLLLLGVRIFGKQTGVDVSDVGVKKDD